MSNAEFSLLLTENADFLKPFAIGLTKDQMTAQDLFQETMYRAFYNKDKYNVGTNIKAWLYTIMRNVFINDYRKKNKLGVLYDISDQQSIIDQSTHKAHNQALHNLRYQEIQKYRLKYPLDPFWTKSVLMSECRTERGKNPGLLSMNVTTRCGRTHSMKQST